MAVRWHADSSSDTVMVMVMVMVEHPVTTDSAGVEPGPRRGSQQLGDRPLATTLTGISVRASGRG